MARPYKNSLKNSELIEFGNTVRSIRQNNGISQESLAERAGIDRSYMGGIERGEHNLSLVNIKKISDALNTPISRIMEKSGL